MTKCYLFIVLVLALGSVAAFAEEPTPGRPPSLEERVVRLESALFDVQNRLTALERGGAEPRGWSCSAQCGGFYNGDLRYHVVSAAGATASVGFSGLQNACDSSSFLFNGVEQHGNERRLIPASIQNSCVRD